MSSATAPDPDDFFAETRMSFGDHIEELRTHLFRAIYGFVIALFASFFIGSYVLEFITAPVKEQLAAYYQRRGKQITQVVDTDPKIRQMNQPTEFVGMTFYLPQLKAVLEGKPIEEINAFKRPVIQEARRPEDAPSIFNRILGRSTSSERPLNENEMAISKGETVTLWVSHAEPVRESVQRLEPDRFVNQTDDPTTLSPMEAFMTYFKVCLLSGLVIGSPWIFFQIWAFVAAGLYPQEKKLVHVYLPFSLFLFLGGVFLCQFLVIPKALETLLWFNEWLGFKPDIRLNEWLSFAILLPVVFGVSFQTPLVMMFLVKLGIMDVETFRGKRRLAWFLMAVFAALITPTPDAITMLLMWVPMILLFELGIYLVARFQPPIEFDEEFDKDEFVGA